MQHIEFRKVNDKQYFYFNQTRVNILISPHTERLRTFQGFENKRLTKRGNPKDRSPHKTPWKRYSD